METYVLKLVVPINIKAQIYTWTFSLYWIKSTQVWGGGEIKWGSFTNAFCILCIQKQILFNLYFLSPKRLIWMSNYFLSRSATKWSLWHWREFAIDIGGELKLTAFEHRWTAVTIISTIWITCKWAWIYLEQQINKYESTRILTVYVCGAHCTVCNTQIRKYANTQKTWVECMDGYPIDFYD